jgi:hypothetical protein
MSEYEADRLVVIRGRMPGYPDTLRGGSVLQPAAGFDAIQLRYWTMCVGQLHSPMPLTDCVVDANTVLDDDGFFTIAVTNDILRPYWLAPEIEWLPWGDEQMTPKTIFLRYLLASPDFPHSIQRAVAQGCGADFKFPSPPSHEGIAEAGECTQEVMGEYYPVAVWCDRDVLRESGWKACFAAAGVE